MNAKLNADLHNTQEPTLAVSASEPPAKQTKLSAARKNQILEKLSAFSPKSPAKRSRSTRNTTVRGQQERQLDLQIWLLHQAMVNKLLQHPELMPMLITKLEQQLSAGQIRHSAYLFWSCAFADFAKPELFRASLLSHEPSAYKYRRRTVMTGLLDETERQQALLAPLPELLTSAPR